MNRRIVFSRISCFLLVIITIFGGSSVFSQSEEQKWIPLFDGKTLTNWKNCEHYKTGKTFVDKDKIVLEQGLMGTSIRYMGKTPFPKKNYIVEYEAMRSKGNDFFAAMTFPVKDGYCTFINGGWGGTLVGLSSIDGMDASENSSSTSFDFENKKWYKFTVCVTDNTIRVWVDKKEIITLITTDSTFSLRLEVESCKPLGFSAWECEGIIKSIRFRTLTSEEVKAQEEGARKKQATFSL